MLLLYSDPELLIVSDSVRMVGEEDYQRISRLMSAEYSDSLRRRHIPSANESVCGALLLAEATLMFGSSCAKVTRGASGKPAYVSGTPCFSISHDNNAVICAVSTKNVGMDLMALPVRFGPETRRRVAARFFTEAEAELVVKSPDSDGGRTFARLWTAREAASKHAGGPLGEMLGCELPNVGKYLHFDFTLSGEKYTACCYC
ncbi:MAG: 4'-phosphopantetheinyl transferase superfamily protein [Clostridia bacterium]|nr:4'-phosphopantetheinyl transferase superfamily protein [Clostridia bacterium]